MNTDTFLHKYTTFNTESTQNVVHIIVFEYDGDELATCHLWNANYCKI